MLATRVTAQGNAWQLYMTEGEAAYQSGYDTDAETLYLAALNSLKAAGPEDPRLPVTLNTLALFYHSQHKYALAAPLYEQVLGLIEGILPAEHPTLATTLNNLAVVYEAEGKYPQAEPLYQRALMGLEKAFGSQHTQVAAALGNYADLLHKLQRHAEAERLEARANAIWAQYSRNHATPAGQPPAQAVAPR
jgi:tetratricopeptide (TPR) repeat protein